MFDVELIQRDPDKDSKVTGDKRLGTEGPAAKTPAFRVLFANLHWVETVFALNDVIASRQAITTYDHVFAAWGSFFAPIAHILNYSPSLVNSKTCQC